MQKKTNVTEEDYVRLSDVFKLLHKDNIWSQVEREDFITKRFELGNVNNILCCELTDDARRRLCKSNLDCPGIVVKFLTKDLFFEVDPFESIMINTTISAHGLGPRLIFANKDVYVNEYIKGRNYNYDDDSDEDTVKQMARLLAKFHYLNPPISNDGFEKWTNMNKNYLDAPWCKPVLDKDYMKIVEKHPKLMEKYGSLLSKLEVIPQFDKMNELTEKSNSPFVFSHTDLNRGNRIVKQVKDNDGKLHSRIYLLDFDYSTFNHRGHDLGRYFSNYRHKDDMWGDEGFPTDQEMELFLETYRQECAKIVGPNYLEQEVNSMEQLIRETKIFTLNAYLTDYFFGVFMILASDQSEQQLQYFLEVTRTRHSGFMKLEKQFIEEGVIDK